MTRGRRVLWIVTWIVVAILVIAALALFTPLGLRIAVWQARARLDGFDVASVDGALFRDMHLRGLRWHRDGITVEVDEAHVAFDRARIVGGRIGLTRLDARGIRVTIVEGEDDPGPQEPLALPDLAFAGIALRDVTLTLGDEVTRFDTIGGGLVMGDTTMQFDQLKARGPNADVDANVAFDLAAVLPRPNWQAIDVAALLNGSGRASAWWKDEAEPWQAVVELRGRNAADVALTLPFAATARLSRTDVARGWRADVQLPAVTDDSRFPTWLEAVKPEGQLIVQASRLETVDIDFDGRLAGQRAAIVGAVKGSVESNELGFDVSARQPDCVSPCFDGTARIAGTVPLDGRGAIAIAAQSEALVIRLAEGDTVAVQGGVRVSQTVDAPLIQPDLTIQRAGMPPLAVAGQLRVTDTFLIAEALRVESGRSVVAIAGALPRTPSQTSEADRPTSDRNGDASNKNRHPRESGDPAPSTPNEATTGTLVLDITHLDPALIAKDWPGTLDGRLRFDGTMPSPGTFTGDATIESLRGTLRDRPVAATGRARLEASTPTTFDVDLRSGGARVVASRAALDAPIIASLRAPSLADLSPDARGALDAEIEFLAEQYLTIDANAGGLAWGDDIAVDTMTAQLRFAPLDDPIPTGTLAATNLVYGGIALTRVDIDATGDANAHDLTARILRGDASYDLRLTGAWRDGGFSGRLEEARWNAGGDTPAASLREPTVFAVRGETFSVEPFCIDIADGSLCGDATRDATGGRANWQANDVTLTPFAPFVPANTPIPDGRLRGGGTLAFDAQGLSRVDGTLASESLLLQLVGVEEVELGLRQLALEGGWTRDGGTVELSSDLSPTGHVDARVRIGADRSIDGHVSGHVERLDWIEAYTSELANARGRIDIDLTVTGTLDAPRYTGEATLADFTAEVPELGVTFSEGRLALRSSGGRDLAVDGSIVSGGGTLTVNGRFDPAQDDPLDVQVKGTDVLVSDSPMLLLRASPDLTAKYDTTQELLVLDGTLAIPRARIDASRVETSARRSADVVVVDDPPAKGRRATPWRARIRVELGRDVAISGFGFDGRARGAIDVRQTATSDATASGELTVSGTYAAYGQKLKIRRGRVLYAGGPLDDPALSIRAERELRDITAGVDVAGTAQRPTVTLYSSPSRTDAEVLSLLMTGRDPRSVAGGDGESLGDAATALGTVGGDALAQSLGGKLGFDEFGVGASDSLDGTAFTIGKYLTPRLFVGYGVGLLESGEVFTVRFRINRRLELEANSGATSRAGVNYTIER